MREAAVNLFSLHVSQDYWQVCLTSCQIQQSLPMILRQSWGEIQKDIAMNLD